MIILASKLINYRLDTIVEITFDASIISWLVQAITFATHVMNAFKNVFKRNKNYFAQFLEYEHSTSRKYFAQQIICDIPIQFSYMLNF